MASWRQKWSGPQAGSGLTSRRRSKDRKAFWERKVIVPEPEKGGHGLHLAVSGRTGPDRLRGDERGEEPCQRVGRVTILEEAGQQEASVQLPADLILQCVAVDQRLV